MPDSAASVPCMACGQWKPEEAMTVAVSPTGRQMPGLWVCTDTQDCWDCIVAPSAPSSQEQQA